MMIAERSARSWLTADAAAGDADRHTAGPGVTARIGTRHIKNTGKNFNLYRVAELQQKTERKEQTDMRREEKREKMYFLQMSSKFFDEIAVKRLVLTGGNDALVIYLRIWCKSLETGGVIELTGMGMEPAEEIALMIDCPAVPQVASVLTMCQAYGLITVGEGDSGKIINFSLTEDYTRAWTREAIMRRNDKTNRIEATEEPAMIEAKEEPEETEEERKKREKKEAAKRKKAEEKARIDEFFERLWAAYIPGHKDDKNAVKAARRKELYEIGEEKCLQALEAYEQCDRVRKGFVLKASKFWNYEISNILDTMQATQQTTQKPQAPTRTTIKAQLEADGVISFEGVDRSRWEKVQSKYADGAKALALEIMKANEI